MTDPERWLLSEELDPDVRKLLRAAPRPQSMTSEQMARSRRRIARLAAVPAAVGAVLWIKKVALAAILGAAGGGAAIAVFSSSPVPQDPAGVVERPSLRSTPQRSPGLLSSSVSPSVQESAEPEALPVNALPLLRMPSAEASDPAQDALGEEVLLLERARAAAPSNPGLALQVLEEHARRFPTARLAAERELLLVDVLHRLGRTAEAREKAEGMLAGSPNGLYGGRLRNMLDTMSGATDAAAQQR